MSRHLGAQQPLERMESGQILLEAERELVDEAYDRLRLFRDGCREIHARAREGRRIALIDDPHQDEPGTEPSRRTLQMQTLRSTLNNCVADQMDNMPEPVMLPETPQMQQVAEDLTDTVRFVLSMNDFESLHRRRVDDYFVTGTAVTQIGWDETMDNGNGNVTLLRWPIEAFLWDPAAENIQDARALIKVSWHPMSYYAARYPDKAKYIGAEPYAIDEVGVPDAWAKQQSGDEDRAMLMEYWYRRFDAKSRKYSVSVAYIAGGALLELCEDIYAHGLYPFVLDAYTPIEGMPVGNGMIHELAPMMRYINRYYRYFDENMRMAAKTRLLVRRDAQIDNDALTDWAKDIIEGANIDEGAVRWLTSAPFTGAATGVAIQLQTDIKQDSGQNQFTRGETAGGVTAASAIAALQEAGGKITRYHTHGLVQGFRGIVTQIMWLIAEFYTDKQVRMVTGRDGKPRAVDMDAAKLFGKRGKGALPAPRYSVQVQVQRRNPMRVQAQNELFIQIYSMAAQAQQPFPVSTLLEMLNVDGKESILPAVRETEKQAELMQQMGAQLQEAQQVIAQREAEVKNLSEALMAQAEAGGGGALSGQMPEAPPGLDAPGV